MNRRFLAVALFIIASVLALLAAADVLGFYGGVAAIVCIVVGLMALPLNRPRGPNNRP